MRNSSLLVALPVGLVLASVGLLACWPGRYAQALPNINSLSVRYNSLKTAAKAEGELKAQIDEVDKAIAEARRTGNMGEMRRQIAKGLDAAQQGSVDAAARLPQFAGAEERAHGDRFDGAVRDAHRADLSASDRAEREPDHEGPDQEARADGAPGQRRRHRRHRRARARDIRRGQPRSSRDAIRDRARSQPESKTARR